ncbi:SAM-dependent methyltransferase, partial [Limosilactobacillus mucosae]|nr:SAM-dependent methyltransferase [Limosilactobacillus mucosae]
MIYGTFAQLYDELFESDMYQQWREFVNSQLPNYAKTILDVAGGAGRLGVLLAEDGYDVID